MFLLEIYENRHLRRKSSIDLPVGAASLVDLSTELRSPNMVHSSSDQSSPVCCNRKIGMLQCQSVSFCQLPNFFLFQNLSRCREFKFAKLFQESQCGNSILCPHSAFIDVVAEPLGFITSIQHSPSINCIDDHLTLATHGILVLTSTQYHRSH
jgi:hypothetical protein